MRSSIAAFMLASLLPLMLSGCGLRGPLYLPDEKPQVSSEAAQPASVESGKTIEAQPAPQAQKRDRGTQTPEQQSAPPAN